jgi:hypothetical protein
MTPSVSISIDGVVYSPSQSKIYDVAGTHTYCSMSNSTLCSYFSILNIPNPSVNISVSNPEVSFEVSNTNIVVDSEKIVRITLNVKNSMTPKSYLYDVIINNVTRQFQFLIPDIEIWNVSNYSFIPVVETGSSGILGYITARSVGNKYSLVDVHVDGNDSMIVTSKSLLLYPNIDAKLEVLYDINRGRLIGDYKTNIWLNNVSVPVNISVKDSVYPEIANFTLKDVTIYDKTNFSFKATDNLKINRTYIEYIKLDTSALKTVDIAAFENDLYIDSETIFTELGDYSARACALDDSNNSVCTDISIFKVKKTNRVIVNEQTIHFKKVKFNTYSLIPLFNITQNINVRIRLDSLHYLNDSTWKMKVIDGDGKTEYFLEQGGEVVANMAGVVRLGFIGDKIGVYDGIITITPDWFNEEKPQMTFTGELIDYTIPEPFSADWYGNQFNCKVVDTGDIDSSYYDCSIRYPILSDLNKTAVPITPSDKESNDRSWEERLNVWKDKNSFKLGIIILFIVCMVVLLMITFYYALVADRIYFKLK